LLFGWRSSPSPADAQQLQQQAQLQQMQQQQLVVGNQTPTQQPPTPQMPTPNMIPSPALVPQSSPQMMQMQNPQRNIRQQSPSASINTPGQVTGNSPFNPQEEALYREKYKQLTKYIEPLKRMLAKISNDGTSEYMMHIKIYFIGDLYFQITRRFLLLNIKNTMIFTLSRKIFHHIQNYCISITIVEYGCILFDSRQIISLSSR